MADRAEFIKDIRSRLQNHRSRGEYRPTHAPDVPWTPSAERRRESPVSGDLPARFLGELEALGGHGRRVASIEEARDYVLSLARERGAELLVRWDEEELEELGVDAPVREAGTEVSVWRDLPDFREVAGSAEIGLTTADWAVAETGSLVVTSGPGHGRSVTLLPPTHVAVVRVEKMLPTVAEAIALYAKNGGLPANVCFHTGPSRSGDIEQALAIGVHGPGDVHVVLVG
ncbi:MAG: lactate utilization protein [Rubrobacter sp.]|nr:lactate utilization protein [Rubrobacter sp.]